MKSLVWVIVVLGLLLGAWLTFDGSRALIAGDYVTPSSGQYAGQLGPWATVVSAIGIPPRSTLMKAVHVGLGAAWLFTTIAFALRAPWAWTAMLACATATLWYLPFGTLIGVIQVVLLLRVRPRLLHLMVALACVPLAAQAPKPAVPIDPIAGIVDAFRTHELVALGDAHGNEQAQDFLKRLVRDKAFRATVNDIVIEFANARYQPLIDRYINGEDVTIATVRPAWKNTTIANEIPVDEEFFAVVREVNRGLPAGRRLRVLAADPPIDWTQVRERADHFKFLAMRDSFPAALIQTEVLAKQRRGLIVYGHLHFQRFNTMANLDMTDWRMQTIVSLIERSTPAGVFTIWNVDDGLATVQADIVSWRAPSLAVVRGTAVGSADVAIVFPAPPRMAFRDGKPVPVPREEWKALRLEDQLDAVLYLGRKSTLTEMPMSKSICSDAGYVEERLRRIALTGIPKFEADRVKKLCGG